MDADGLDGRAAVADLCDDVDVIADAEERAEALTDDGVILRENYPDRRVASGHRAPRVARAPDRPGRFVDAGHGPGSASPSWAGGCCRGRERGRA